MAAATANQGLDEPTTPKCGCFQPRESWYAHAVQYGLGKCTIGQNPVEAVVNMAEEDEVVRSARACAAGVMGNAALVQVQLLPS